MMLLSVVVTAYNDEDYVSAALESVYDQRVGNHKLEVIVVNNCSTDGTQKKLERLQKQYAFTLLTTTHNGGPSLARNTGILAASGEKIAFLDGDDYWLEGRMNTLLKEALQTKAGVVFSDALIEQDGALTDIKQSSLMAPPNPKDNMLEHLFKRNCINMCAVLMDTSLAKKVRFNESLASAEDYDFWIRTAASGVSFSFVDQPLVVYRRYGESLSSRRLHSIDNTLTMLQQNKNLATTTTALSNLKQQKTDLYEERLKVSESRADILKSIKKLRSLRKLGKKEVLILRTTQLAGFAAGKNLINKLVY